MGCCGCSWEQQQTQQQRAVIPEAGLTTTKVIPSATDLLSCMPWIWILVGYSEPMALG